MYITNGDVSLREFVEEDIENKIRWINDPRNNQYLHYDIPLNYERTLKWFLNKDNQRRLDCVIEYKGIPVGLIGLLDIDYTNLKTGFYISMGELEYQGRGIASIATQMLLQYVFNDLKLNKIYLNVDAKNKAARSFYIKNGFREEGIFIEDMMHRGVLIDRIRYALLLRDYQK